MDKTNNELKFQSGNDAQIWNGTDAFVNWGKLISGKMVTTEGDVSVEFNDGETFEGPGQRACKFTVVLGQVSKEAIDLINQLRGKLLPFYYNNGEDIGGTKMGIFIPQLRIKSAFELDMKGSTLQTIAVEGSCAPQDADAVCTPDTDLPGGTPFSGADPVTSYNPFYVILKQAAA